MRTHLPYVKLPRDDKRWPCIESRSRKGKSGSRAGTDLMARPDSAQSFHTICVPWGGRCVGGFSDNRYDYSRKLNDWAGSLKIHWWLEKAEGHIPRWPPQDGPISRVGKQLPFGQAMLTPRPLPELPLFASCTHWVMPAPEVPTAASDCPASASPHLLLSSEPASQGYGI